MKIILIRHGKTAGNLEKRYIGRTDEGLCEEGVRELLERKERGIYLKEEALSYEDGEIFVSPMKRCRETAELLYPHVKKRVVEAFREMDFGIFEGKNYQELSGNPAYEKWLAGQCRGKVPGGESMEELEKRCCAALVKLLEEETSPLVLVVHGGTIMALLHGLALPQKDFYEYYCDNGDMVICDGVKSGTGWRLEQK